MRKVVDEYKKNIIIIKLHPSVIQFYNLQSDNLE